MRPEELDRYLALARTLGDEVEDVLAGVTAALLQSPNFLYRSEIGVPDPTDPGRRLLTSFELAARLSYFLWAAPPDEALLDAAESGALATDAGLEAQTRRLLASPRARSTMAEFFVELFRLRRLDRINESRTKYRQYTPTLGASMRGETLRLIEAIAFDPGRDFREIFSARFTYLNPELARLYGLPTPPLARPTDYVRVELPPQQGRAGVLGHGSFLTIFAHATTSSPTKRGKFIRESLLCQAVPPPPPDVATRLPKDEEGKPARTTRQKLEAHRKDARCNGCHKAMDPLGLAFEGFDGIGAARQREAGLPIDTSGELDGVSFGDPGQLGALLSKSAKTGRLREPGPVPLRGWPPGERGRGAAAGGPGPGAGAGRVQLCLAGGQRDQERGFPDGGHPRQRAPVHQIRDPDRVPRPPRWAPAGDPPAPHAATADRQSRGAVNHV